MDLGHAASKLVSVVSKWAPTVPVCSHSGEEEGNGTWQHLYSWRRPPTISVHLEYAMRLGNNSPSCNPRCISNYGFYAVTLWDCMLCYCFLSVGTQVSSWHPALPEPSLPIFYVPGVSPMVHKDSRNHDFQNQILWEFIFPSGVLIWIYFYPFSVAAVSLPSVDIVWVPLSLYHTSTHPALFNTVPSLHLSVES